MGLSTKIDNFFDGVEMVILGIICVQNCAFFVRNVYKYALFGFYARRLRNFYQSTKGFAQKLNKTRKNGAEIKKNQEIERKY